MSTAVFEGIIRVHVFSCIAALYFFPDNRATQWLTTYKNGNSSDTTGRLNMQSIARIDREYTTRQDKLLQRMQMNCAAYWGFDSEKTGPRRQRFYETYKEKDLCSRYMAKRFISPLGEQLHPEPLPKWKWSDLFF